MLEKHGLNQQKYAIQYRYRYSYMEHWKLNGCWARKIKEIRPYPQERKTNFLNGYFPKEFFLFDSFSSLIWHGWKLERSQKKCHHIQRRWLSYDTSDDGLLYQIIASENGSNLVLKMSFRLITITVVTQWAAVLLLVTKPDLSLS